MMDIFSRKSMLLMMAAGAMTFSACSHDDNLYEGEKPGASTDKTAENFMGMVGNIDPNQTWETVKNVEVSSNLKFSTPLSQVQIFADGKLVGATASTDGSFSRVKVTVPSYATTISAKFVTSKGFASSLSTAINGEKAQFGDKGLQRVAGTRAEGNRTCVEFAKTDRDVYRKTLWNEHYQEMPSVWPDKYYYVGENALGDMVPVPNDLLDKINKIVPENNKSAYYETIVQDVELTTETAGPVTLKMISATTSNQAAIGYYFYDSKEVDNTDYTAPVTYDANNTAITVPYQNTREPKKLANKYVIIPNVQNRSLYSKSETKYVGYDTPKKDQWGNDVWGENITTNYVSEIKLLYVNEQTGEVSETFPAGIKIGFFIMPNALCSNSSYINAKHTAFSLGAMNVNVHTAGIEDGPLHIYSDYYSGFDTDEKRAMSHAATFMVDDKVIIGFEDAPQCNSGDFDYNDCIFMLDGSFKPNIPDPEKPTVQTFTYCYEDISTDGGDYDINDCVLKVTAPDADGNIDVTLAAVGATYQLKAWLGNQALFGGKELHQVLGVATDVMVNTGLASATPVTQTISVGKDWNIMVDGNFWLEVITTGKNVTIPQFTASFTPGTVPYAFRIADDFDYPSERQAITAKYPLFKNWANDATQAIDWYKK